MGAVAPGAQRRTPCRADSVSDIFALRPRCETCGSRPEHGADMAYIPYVPYDEADGLLAELYRKYKGPRDWIDNIIRIHSLNPRSMRDHMGLYSHLMRGPSPLSRVQREMLAVVVSAQNDCFY